MKRLRPSDSKNAFDYEAKSAPRRVRHVVSGIILAMLAAAWPSTQVVGLYCKELALWTWGSTDFSLDGSMQWNSSGICFAVRFWRCKWIADEDRYRKSVPNEPTKLRFGPGHFAIRWATPDIRAQKMGPLTHLPHRQLAAFGVEIEWLFERLLHTDRVTRAQAKLSKNAIQITLPSWLLGLVSLTAGVILVRRWRGTKRGERKGDGNALSRPFRIAAILLSRLAIIRGKLRVVLPTFARNSRVETEQDGNETESQELNGDAEGGKEGGRGR